MAQGERSPAWLLGLGAVALGSAAAVLAVTFLHERPLIESLRTRGMVVDAVVLDRTLSTQTNTQGRTRVRRAVTLGYGTAGATPYNLSAARDEDAPAATQEPAARTSAELLARLDAILDEAFSAPAFPYRIEHSVSGQDYEALSIGDRISVTFLPDDPAKARVTEDVRAFTPLPWLALGLVFGFAGVWATVAALRRWKSR